MDTPGDPETLAEESCKAAKPPETHTLGVPVETQDTDPSPAGSGGREESRVSGIGLPEKVQDIVGAACTDDAKGPAVLDSEVAEDSASVVVLETVAVDSSSCTSVDVVGELGFGFPANGLEGKAQEEGVGRFGGGGGEGMGFVEKLFGVGDLVWAKVKGQPWWPGQVCDSSDALEFAKKSHPKDRRRRLLVAHFGDGAFVWNDPNQLRPLMEGFEKMVAQSSSKNFVLAVKEALNEVRRRWELQMICHCVPAEARDELVTPLLLNSGVKEGVTVHQWQKRDPAVSEKSPSELLQRLHDLACDVSIANMLEVTMILSWFSAFDRVTDHRIRLPVYDHLQEIVDLNEENSHSAASFRDLDEVQPGEDWLSTPITRSGPLEGPDILEDRLYERKKQRSMAELIAEMDMEMDDAIDGAYEEVVAMDQPASTTLKPKRKDETKGSDCEIGDASVEEEHEPGASKRERKKSKYLSPPYTMLSGSIKRSMLPKEADMETPKKALEASQVKESVGRTVGRPPNSSRIAKCNGWASQGKVIELDASVNELLLEFHATALCSLHLKRSPFSSLVRDFFARFRKSVYDNGSESVDDSSYLNKSNGEDISTPCSEINRTGEGKLQITLEGQYLAHETDNSEEVKSGDSLSCKANGNEKENLMSMESVKGQPRGRMKGKTLDHNIDACDPMSVTNVKGKSDGSIQGKFLDHITHAGEEPMSIANVRGKSKCPIQGKFVDNAPNGPEQGKSKPRRKRKDGGEETMATDISKGKSVANVTFGSDGGKSGRKRKKKGREETMPTPDSMGKFVRNDTNVSELGKPGQTMNTNGCKEALRRSTGIETNGSEEGSNGQKRRRRRKKKNDEANCETAAALFMTFSPGVPLPSKEDLISTFRRFGELCELETEPLKDSCCARVLFAKSSDAEKAFKSCEKNGPFWPAVINSRVRYLPGNLNTPSPLLPLPNPPNPPPPFVSKNLERMRKSLEGMISTLTSPSLPANDTGSSDGSKPEATDNLVNDMNGLLLKVKKLLGGHPSVTNT